MFASGVSSVYRQELELTLFSLLMEHPEIFQMMLSRRQPQVSYTGKPEEDLLTAAKIGNHEKIKTLLSTNPAIVNSQDKISGRSALHHLSTSSSPQRMASKRLLLDYKINVKHRDREGFTAAELELNPHEFDEKMALDSKFMEETTAEIYYLVSEKNAEWEGDPLHAKKHLEIVFSPEDMVKYVEDHPEYSQIGFLIAQPNAIRRMPHLSPIIFDRSKNSYTQLDSFAFAYLIPKSATKESTVYFSTIPRQVDGVGCDKDTFFILVAVLTDCSSVLDFCRKVSKESNLLQPLDESESKDATFLETKQMYHHHFGGPALTLEEQKRQLNFTVRKQAEIQLKAFKGSEIEPITAIRTVDIWPSQLAKFVGRHDVFRLMRTSGLLTTSFLNQLLESGDVVPRDPTASRSAVVDNMRNPDKKFDVASKPWAERDKEVAAARQARFSFCKDRLFEVLGKQDGGSTKEENEKAKVDAEKVSELIAAYAVGRGR